MFIAFQNAREKGFRSVDLHHLFKDEAEELLFLIFQCIKNSPIETKRNSVFEIEVITGKGKHSKNGAVLMPHLVPILEEQGHKIVRRDEGRMVCNVRL